MKHLILTLALALVGRGAPAQADTAQPLSHTIANDVALYAMMASNAYVGDSEKLHFPLEKLGWQKVDMNGNAVPADRNSYRPKSFVGDFFSNLQFDIWEDTNSPRTVFAFKGTQEKIDWVSGNLMIGVSIPYKSAKKHVRDYITAHPGRRVSVTGHSLGGGLALSVSFWEGVDAMVFNTSPRIFDGLKDANRQARRLAAFQESDVLQKIRRWYPKFLEKVRPDQVVETRFDYAGRNAHRSDLMAQGLLACSTDPALQEFARRLNLSVACPLP